MSSTQALPSSEPAWVVPPGSAIRLEWVKRRRTSRLPSNGVAASRVSPISSALVPPPRTVTGVPALTGQVRHGALNHVFGQVTNGATRWVRQASSAHVLHERGQGASVQPTAL